MANDNNTLEWLIRMDREEAQALFNMALYCETRARTATMRGISDRYWALAKVRHEQALFYICRAADLRLNGRSTMKWEG